MKSKILGTLTILLIGVLLVTSGVLAFFTDDAKPALSRFLTGMVKIAFHGQPVVVAESPHVDEQEVTWAIKNTGNNDVFLRAKVIEGFKKTGSDLDGDIVVEAGSRDWQKGKDGYYYYVGTKPISPGECVDFTLQVYFDVWKSIRSYPLDIEVEAIQASNDAAEYSW